MMNVLLDHPAEILILLFLTVTFLQSGVDKVLDWKGNLEFIKGHFSGSPLGGMVPLLLGIITIMELGAAILMSIGMIQLMITGREFLALLGVELAALSLIFLLVGQRLAKDYGGAMTLAVYFIIAVMGVYLLA